MNWSLAALEAERDELTIERGGATLTVGYRPNAYTDEFLEKMLGGELTLNRALEVLVSDWDLMGKDDQPVPLTEEALRAVPMPVKRLVFKEIGSKLFPNLIASAFTDSG